MEKYLFEGKTKFKQNFKLYCNSLAVIDILTNLGWTGKVYSILPGYKVEREAKDA